MESLGDLLCLPFSVTLTILSLSPSLSPSLSHYTQNLSFILCANLTKSSIKLPLHCIRHWLCLCVRPSAELCTHVSQVVLLQYCRGGNTGRKNTSAQELQAINLIESIIDHDQLRRGSSETGYDHSWASVELKEKFYLAFSTLSDSK